MLAAGPAYAIDPNLFTINGYTSFEVEKQWGDEGNGDPNLSFDADLFDVVFNFLPTDRVRAAVDLTWEHGAASEDGRGNVAIEYGFVEYRVADTLRVRAGKMFTPFGIYNEIHTAKPAFLSVKEAPSTNKPERIVEADRYFPRWATGLAITGDAFPGSTHLDYNLMISNGEQEETNPYEEDNNVDKSFTGRVRLEAGPVRVGASSYYDYIGPQPGENGYHLFSQGLQVEAFLGPFELAAEGVVGIRDYNPDAVSTLTQYGAFVQPALRLDRGVTPYARVEFVEPDVNTEADEGVGLVGGVNLQLARGLQVKLEHNYFWGAEQSSLAEFENQSYNEFKGAVVLGF